jgi:pilus assembly protein CpaF
MPFREADMNGKTRVCNPRFCLIYPVAPVATARVAPVVMAEAAQTSLGLYWEQIKLQETTMNENELLNALGPLAPLYTDPTVMEITVDAPDRVYVWRAEKHEDLAMSFGSTEALRGVIDAVMALGGVTLGPDKTIGETRFPDGSRMLAIIPPTAPDGPCLVIRRFASTQRASQISWEFMLEHGVLSREAYEFLQNAMRASISTLVSGGTASGKTTLANRLIELIPADRRVVIVEAVHEINARHPRCVYLEAGGPANVPFADLIGTASIMGPDYMVIGEVWGPEAMRALQVKSHGHNGLMTTHAESTEDALTRLETMCLMANLGLGLGEIRRMVASALQLLIFQEKLPAGRRITQITELRGLENDRYVLAPLFRYNADKDALERTSTKASWE